MLREDEKPAVRTEGSANGYLMSHIGVWAFGGDAQKWLWLLLSAISAAGRRFHRQLDLHTVCQAVARSL